MVIIKTTALDDLDAAALRMSPNDVCPCMERITYSMQNHPIEVILPVDANRRRRLDACSVTRKLILHKSVSGSRCLYGITGNKAVSGRTEEGCDRGDFSGAAGATDRGEFRRDA